MKYILTKDYEGKCISGEVKFANGDTFDCIGSIISQGKTPICFTTSQLAYEHFADDTDGQGELRGKWINRIAFWQSGEGYRLTEEQRRVLSEYYPKYIRHDCDTIIFNDKFYHLPIETYEMMGQDLGMKLEDM